jgi:predicted transcriptional regulator
MTGRDLSAFRDRMSLTKKALAEALGIDRKTAQRYEEGAAPIPRYIALACAALAHGVPPL